MRKRINKNFVLLLSLSVVFCLIATSCLTFLSTVGGLIFNFSDRLSENRIIVYGNQNDLSVTFRDGRMLAIWDSNSSSDYLLTVVKDGIATELTPEEEGYIDLTSAGYGYGDNLHLDLAKMKSLTTTHFTYDYSPITKDQYNTYTVTVNAGFSEIDRYIATRAEWFDFFSYLIVFRDDAKTETEDGETTYLIETTCLMSYDFTSFAEYDGLSTEECLENEVYSAIDAYEDSASYAYSFSLEDDQRTTKLYIKFYYLNTPDLETDTAEKYVNSTKPTDRAHYTTGVINTRSFPIDQVEKTISVSTSDQLYFALKKGYRPVPVAGSNADLIYTKMRSILATINTDNDSVYNKLHYIYDYIVNTVIYDYTFTDELMNKEDSQKLFRYKCLYLEGVFGVQNNKTIDERKRVAICDGLSKAYMCMATIEGIPCIKISGTVNDQGHAWNKAKIGTNWYLIDTTWGNDLSQHANVEYLSHDYFCVKDDVKHVENPYVTYPEAPYDYKASTGFHFGSIA